MDADVIKTHPAIWFLYNDVDGERSMTYDGARVRCGRSDCEGFTDQLECPKGCGVRIESNQEERDEQFRCEMAERDAERKRYREERLTRKRNLQRDPAYGLADPIPRKRDERA